VAIHELPLHLIIYVYLFLLVNKTSWMKINGILRINSEMIL